MVLRMQGAAGERTGWPAQRAACLSTAAACWGARNDNQAAVMRHGHGDQLLGGE